MKTEGVSSKEFVVTCSTCKKVFYLQYEYTKHFPYSPKKGARHPFDLINHSWHKSVYPKKIRMTCAILGLIEGKNYPIRKENETVLDLSQMNNIMVVDMDYFLNHVVEIEQSIKQIMKSSNK